MPRQTTGCWTCRARKKKCDDARPSCSTCQLRCITCYGYGDDKPDWIDGGGREREMLRVMQAQCKVAYSQRRTAKATSKLTVDASLPSHPAKTSSHSQEGAQTRRNINGRIPRQQINSSPGNQESLISAKQPQPSYIPSPFSVMSTPSGEPRHFSHNDGDLSLVMYYLDHIFPRLCPFFQYDPGDDGRGWILSLFLRTKPLCALAVCISACDKAQLVLGQALNERPQPHQDLEMQHIQIVTDLRDHLGRLVCEDGSYQMSAAVEALACVMHLVLFELWIPRKNDMQNDWIMHMEAASVLLDSVARTPNQSPNCVEAANIEDHFPIDSLSVYEVAAFRYYFTQHTFYLTNMVASFGLTPRSRLSLNRTQAIFHSGQGKLQGMIGCADWVLTTILDIAVLKEWKSQMQDTGMLDLVELANRADRMEVRLTEGLAALSSKTISGSSHEQQEDMVTSIFTNGALLFLHAVTSGFRPNLSEIRLGVLRTLEALEHMRRNSAINIPSWPYCVAGCLAMDSLHPRFRALYPKPSKGSHPLVNTKWSIDIMEESWRLRKNQPANAEICDWGTIMTNFGTRILLA